MSLRAVGKQPVQLYAAPAYGQPGSSFRVTNLDTVNTIYLDDNITVEANSTPLPPQASAVYDGTTDVWASSLSSSIVLVDYAPGSTYYDNPVGVQIALNALGLATAANQATQNTTAQATNTVLGSGIALPINAAQETGGNLATQTGYQAGSSAPSAFIDTAGMSLMDSISGRVNLLANGDFRRGANTWSVTNCTQNVVSSGLPGGWPRKFGNQLTPSGTATSLQLNGPTIPAAPGQIFACRGWFNQAAQAVGETVQLQLRFVNSANTTIATVSSAKTAFVNQVSHLDLTGSSNISTVAGVRLIIVYTGATGNIPAADVLTVGDLSVHSGTVAGMPATANDIANTGAPLLKQHNVLFTAASTALTVGTPVNVPSVITAFNQIGYSLFFQCYAAAAAQLQVNVVWFDTASGQAVDQQTYWINPGSGAGNPHGVRITGPTEGNGVQITLTAFTNNITVANLLFAQSSTVYQRHFPLTTVMTTLAGVANVAFTDPLAFLLGDISATLLATGANQVTVPAFYAGRVMLFGGTTSGTTDMSVNVSVTADQSAAGGHTLYQDNTDAKGFLNAYLSLPRSQCSVTVTNQNAGNQSCRFTLVVAPEG